jgi:transketolase
MFLWDDNRMTDDGVVEIASSDDMLARFRASNWHVQEVEHSRRYPRRSPSARRASGRPA